jgi:hypothetical protein
MKWLLCFSLILFFEKSFSIGGISLQNSKSDLFSISGCEIKYDNKKIDLEWSVEKISKKLGEPDQYFEDEFKDYKSIYMAWEAVGVTIQKSQHVNGAKNSVLFINLIEHDYDYYKWYKYENNWSVLKIYNETPYSYGNAYPYKGFILDDKKIKPGISYKDFFDLYGYDLKDFEIKGKSYLLKRSCEDGRHIYFNIGQGGGWTYKGSGHLMYKDKYIPVRPDPIRYIYIWFE